MTRNHPLPGGCGTAVVVVDAGNSSTSVARYQAGRVSRMVSIRGGLRSCPAACRDAVRRAAAGVPPRGAMLASVVPALNTAWRRLLEREAGGRVVVLRHDLPLPFRLDYRHPETTGADRLANVAAALARHGAPALVVDIGTAVTYDLLSADRRFFTGAIGPGPEIMARALHDHTAQLPLLEWWRRRPPPLPKDTAGAMSFGIEAAFLGALRETVLRLRPLLGRGAHLVATGGFARRFIPALEMGFVVEPDLTLAGLGLLFDFQLEARPPPVDRKTSSGGHASAKSGNRKRETRGQKGGKSILEAPVAALPVRVVAPAVLRPEGFAGTSPRQPAEGE